MKQQNGSALTVTLVMLVMALMMGISSMQSSLVDERMAGNYKAQSQAQMAAEKAAAEGVVSIYYGVSSIIPDEYNINNLHAIDWVKFTGEKGKLSPDSLSLDVCPGTQTECYYRFIKDNAGNQYVAAMGVVVEGGGVIAVSEPLVVDLVSSYGGVSAALNIYGGIHNINKKVGSNPGKEEVWYPTSENSRVAGGDFGDEDSGTGSVSSMYYEGVELNSSTLDSIASKDTFPDGYDYGGNLGQTGLDSMAFLGEIYQVAMESGNTSTTLSDSDFVGKDDSCSVYKFAVVNSFDHSGNKKFCGVLVYLGGDLALGGTAVVEGLVLAANPHMKTLDDDSQVFDFSKRSQHLNLMFSGGGKKGSVYFNETAVEGAFNLIGENYRDYLKGGSKTSRFNISGWGAR
ncbi:pilus assembly PilX family protein [Halomonas icarae]|uniref:Type 4 fimbrial biogenesis protein PilX N-terminal domain-containing protein n=1 Tax=Halomonas icarae TaxID=2691040 RepID=A0A7X5AM11_9GAMM|nr:pilus assembly PilX N-terminal domain-containing protein [Halomonas icarae]MDR5903578.1 pilus assembly PilX N-terminal domain-containing protein [Halomonas icarae]NAW14027.1 hypothetical protein [Halomonas icarae]